MGHTLTIRLPAELAGWLEETARRSGMSQGEIVRAQLEHARSERKARPFMRLAGCIEGPRDLSRRKGFSKE
jgi:Ribbon-helix-helix protein, copG family